MKLVDELTGVGEVFENDSLLGNVNYHINIFQEMIKTQTFGNNENEEEGLKEVVGKFSSDNLWHLLGKNLTLVLEDGRKIRFFMKNNHGEVQFSGEFF
ncbi:MAG: hypothetical protein MUC29_08570 [Pyrinomonadaceae bacterium]|jgi:hypothetical protein|nr:hypothetical protein [Pyrinomonadaceae bacterium]